MHNCNIAKDNIPYEGTRWTHIAKCRKCNWDLATRHFRSEQKSLESRLEQYQKEKQKQLKLYSWKMLNTQHHFHEVMSASRGRKDEAKEGRGDGRANRKDEQSEPTETYLDERNSAPTITHNDKATNFKTDLEVVKSKEFNVLPVVTTQSDRKECEKRKELTELKVANRGRSISLNGNPEAIPKSKKLLQNREHCSTGSIDNLNFEAGGCILKKTRFCVAEGSKATQRTRGLSLSSEHHVRLSSHAPELPIIKQHHTNTTTGISNKQKDLSFQARRTLHALSWVGSSKNGGLYKRDEKRKIYNSTEEKIDDETEISSLAEQFDKLKDCRYLRSNATN